MAVLLHARDRNVDISAFPEKGQQLLIQKFRVTAKIVVGIRADNAVKKFCFKRQSGCIRFDWNDFCFGQTHFPEEPPVFLRIAPKIRGIDGKTVFLCQKHAGQSLSDAEVTDHAPGRNSMSGQQFFL